MSGSGYKSGIRLGRTLKFASVTIDGASTTRLPWNTAPYTSPNASAVLRGNSPAVRRNRHER
jgi:hypothetical protein